MAKKDECFLTRSCFLSAVALQRSLYALLRSCTMIYYNIGLDQVYTKGGGWNCSYCLLIIRFLGTEGMGQVGI